LLAIVKSLSGLGLAALSRWLLNHYPELSKQELSLIYALISIFFVLLLVVIYFRVYLPTYISSNVIKQMRQQLYRHLQRLNAEFYVQHKTGEIVSRMTNDISMAQLLFSTLMINIAFDFISIVAATGYIVFTYPVEIYLPVLGISCAYGIFVKIFFPRIRKRSRLVQEEMGKITGEVSEKIVGMKVLQSFTQEELASHAVDERLESHYFETLRMAKLESFFSSFIQFLPELARFLVVVIGIYLITASRLTMGDVTGLILVLGPIFISLRRTGDTTVQLGGSLGSLDRVFDFFDAQPTVKEEKNFVNLKSMDGYLEFKNVSFFYPQSDKQLVLKNILFSIEAGTRAAFVGPSGAGKSTMMDLISRFYDPSEGAILIDHVDTRKMSLEFLRSNIGIVMQETILFSGTIAENLRIGKPDATDEEVIEALNNAYAWEFVGQMRHGINSLVGERGITLSGGQKQRLAIARVFLKNPKILILDEATSALDSESEYYVQQALQKLMQGRTTLIIAHRLATIKNVEHIYVLDKGEIVEHGTESELLNRNEIFKKLYAKQTLAFDEI
jgi:subfamily B ATP-binding cassette protein MsbA